MRRASVVIVVGLVVLAGCAPPPPSPPVIVGFGTGGAPFSAPALVALRWMLSDFDGDTLSCRIDTQADGTWDLTVDPCPTSGSRNVAMTEGTHTARIEVSDGRLAPVTATTSYSVAPGPTEPYDIELSPTSVLDPAVQEAFDRAVERWQSVIVRGVPEAHVEVTVGSCGPARPFTGVVDDLMVDVIVAPIEGGYSGAAAPCSKGPDELPRHAFVQLDATHIDTWIAWGTLDDLIGHELGHALGFGGSGPFERFIEGGFASPNPSFNGPRAVAVWSGFGQSGYPPLEWPGDHWSEHDFTRELMTPGLGNKPNPLSALTIAAMADLGYHVDLSAAEPYELPVQGLRGAQPGNDRTTDPPPF
jgi:hypothetical protein